MSRATQGWMHPVSCEQWHLKGDIHDINVRKPACALHHFHLLKTFTSQHPLLITFLKQYGVPAVKFPRYHPKMSTEVKGKYSDPV